MKKQKSFKDLLPPQLRLPLDPWEPVIPTPLCALPFTKSEFRRLSIVLVGPVGTVESKREDDSDEQAYRYWRVVYLFIYLFVCLFVMVANAMGAVLVAVRREISHGTKFCILHVR
jgi:hypothetical protein